MILKTSDGKAPMPKNEEEIKNNSMKLFAYLNTIAGLATYPQHTRMFRQKDLMLTKIKEATGITDKTIKLYMYYLEQNKLIEYRGLPDSDDTVFFDFNKINSDDYSTTAEHRAALQKYIFEVWKTRNKAENKSGVYHIPRPSIYIQIPEITLDILNDCYQASELEFKLYFLMCKYKDDCIFKNREYKYITYEQIRDILDYSKHSANDKAIFNALCFLSQLNLVKFTLGYQVNRKNAQIPNFKITEVNYYITAIKEEYGKNEQLTADDIEGLKEVNQRIDIGFIKQKERE